MHKFFRVAIALLSVALALYLMVTLFFVFLILAGIGLIYLLFIRFFSKRTVTTRTTTTGVIIEHEPLPKEDDAEKK